MTQEEKDLLFKDLCARLNCGVKVHYKYYDFVGGTEQLVSEDDAIIMGINTTLGNPIQVDGYYVEVEHIKPYLRPMSSMTEEEDKEFALFQTNFYTDGFLYPIAATNMIDWLNRHHFDYRGLIPKGLALEAKEGMYIIKTKK